MALSPPSEREAAGASQIASPVTASTEPSVAPAGVTSPRPLGRRRAGVARRWLQDPLGGTPTAWR